MPLKMRPVTPADSPALGAVYFSAFSDNPVLTTCFPPSSPECRAFICSSFAEEVNAPRSRWFAITDTDHAEDPEMIIAWAKWVPPAKDGEVNAAPPPPQEYWPKEGNPVFANKFFGDIGRKHAEIMGEVRHWYLELIVCHKEHQGKGAASLLMRWGCERADEDGVVAFLEAMPKAKAVYEKYGFETVHRMEFKAPSGETITQDFMMRKGNATEDAERILSNVSKLN